MRQHTIDKDHDTGQVFLDVVSDYRERQPVQNEEILTFYSMEPSEQTFEKPADATPSTAAPGAENGAHHEPPHRPRRMVRCGRTGEFYGYRDRIPSMTDVDLHPDDYWWSNANLARPVIAKDMGDELTVLSRAIKVTVVPSSFFASHRDIEVFPEYHDLCKQEFIQRASQSPVPAAAQSSSSALPTREKARLIVFKLKMGEQVMVALNEVINEAEFDRIFQTESRDELLRNKFKFILSPVNSPLPIPAKTPKHAETVGDYFGMDNVDFYVDDDHPNMRVVSILINIYSKWIIRKFLPLATSALGRICDFILCSSDEKLVYADFRLLSTEVSKALIKGNYPPHHPGT